MKTTITNEQIRSFALHLHEDEKSEATVEKYIRDVSAFSSFLRERELTKQEVIEYKKQISENYAPASVNSMLVSINSFLDFIGFHDLRVKLLKIQRQMFVSEKKELTAAEYRRLLKAAQGTRLALVIQTICETGIRVSELEFITVEAVECGRAVVDCKNKTRVILIPTALRKILLQYIKKTGVKAGSVFVTKTGEETESKQYLERYESALRKSKRRSGKSLSAQPSPSICKNVLLFGKRYCSACRSAWTQQHQYNKSLHHRDRKRALQLP